MGEFEGTGSAGGTSTAEPTNVVSESAIKNPARGGAKYSLVPDIEY